MKNYYSILLYLFVAFSSVFISCGENEENEDMGRYRIIVASMGGGKAMISQCNGTMDFVLKGSRVEVVAIPDDGYAFAGWCMGNSTEFVSTEPVFTFVATKNTTLTAMFTKLSNITICSAGNGRVSFTNGNLNSIAVLSGTEVTVVAIPDEGFLFSGWFVGDEPVSTDTKYTFVAMGDIVLTAMFWQLDANGHDYVDLGLPSGLLWATCNVGAVTPYEDGCYYAWGETEEKDNYSWSTYKWCKGSSSTMTKYCTNSGYGKVDNKTVLEPEDDVAHVRWGGSWRMPTEAELDELRSNCIWTSKGRVYEVKSKINGNCIFLPTSGCRKGTEIYSRGSEGNCWSSSLGSYSGSAYNLYFFAGSPGVDDYDRCEGRTVRPVI